MAAGLQPCQYPASRCSEGNTDLDGIYLSLPTGVAQRRRWPSREVIGLNVFARRGRRPSRNIVYVEPLENRGACPFKQSCGIGIVGHLASFLLQMIYQYPTVNLEFQLLSHIPAWLSVLEPTNFKSSLSPTSRISPYRRVNERRSIANPLRLYCVRLLIGSYILNSAVVAFSGVGEFQQLRP